MIDIHSHLLPGVDDGSNEISESLEQLRLIAAQGVNKIYLTPHFMQHIYTNSRATTEPVMAKLRAAVQKAAIDIELELGAEFFLGDPAAEIVKRNCLTLGNSDYVLTETMMQQMPADFLENIYDLQKAGYKVILAHPERYQDIIRQPEIVEELLHRDILMQVNAGSFLGFYGNYVQKTAYYLLEHGYLHFIASDNHGNQANCFQKVVFQMISENYSPAIAQLLLQENPAAISSNEKINIFNRWRLPKPPKNFLQNLKEFFTGHE